MLARWTHLFSVCIYWIYNIQKKKWQRISRHMGGGFVVFWEAVRSHERTLNAILHGRQDADEYCNVWKQDQNQLNEVLIQRTSGVSRQQNNAATHTEYHTKNLFCFNFVHVLDRFTRTMIWTQRKTVEILRWERNTWTKDSLTHVRINEWSLKQ